MRRGLLLPQNPCCNLSVGKKGVELSPLSCGHQREGELLVRFGSSAELLRKSVHVLGAHKVLQRG